jgi:hypothetical protein
MIAAKVAVGSDHGEDVQPAHQRPRPAPAGGGGDTCTQAGSLRHRERLDPDLTQRDMWVMHSPSGDTLLSPPPSGDTLISPPPSGGRPGGGPGLRCATTSMEHAHHPPPLLSHEGEERGQGGEVRGAGIAVHGSHQEQTHLHSPLHPTPYLLSPIS